jgi:hypothetical protein
MPQMGETTKTEGTDEVLKQKITKEKKDLLLPEPRPW